MGRFGDFNFRPLVNAFERDSSYMWPEVIFQGMPLSASWTGALLYGENDERIFVLTREQPPRVANAFGRPGHGLLGVQVPETRATVRNPPQRPVLKTACNSHRGSRVF